MSTSTGEAILAVLESDLLIAAGAPLLTFLQSVQVAAGDPLKMAAAWVKLQGDLVGGAIPLETTLITQVVVALEGKLAAAIAAAQAKASGA